MNALTYMKQYMGAQLTGEQPPPHSLSDLVTEKEKIAMEDTPFGRLNEMLGLVVGLDDDDAHEDPDITQMVRLTPKQMEILDIAHKKMLFALFQVDLEDLAAVYEFACSEDDFCAFMDDFPHA